MRPTALIALQQNQASGQSQHRSIWRTNLRKTAAALTRPSHRRSLRRPPASASTISKQTTCCCWFGVVASVMSRHIFTCARTRKGHTSTAVVEDFVRIVTTVEHYVPHHVHQKTIPDIRPSNPLFAVVQVQAYVQLASYYSIPVALHTGLKSMSHVLPYATPAFSKCHGLYGVHRR